MLKKISFYFFLNFGLVNFLLINFSLANSKTTQTKITSDVMDIKRKSQTIDFLGNVVVKNGADSMIAQKMTVFYDDSKKTATSQEKSVADKQIATSKDSSVKKIVAQNDVKIFSSEFVASADSGYYDPKEEIFMLENNVVVNDGSSIGNGEKFIYSLKTRKGHFIGQSKNISSDEDGRVVVVIGSDAKDKHKKSSNKNDKNIKR